MNEELFSLFDEAVQRGEVDLKKPDTVRSWFRSRGLDENTVEPRPTIRGPFTRGLTAGVLSTGLGGTAERISRAFGQEEAAAKYREMAREPGRIEEERGLLGTAPRPLGLLERRPTTLTEAIEEQAPSKAFAGGELTGAFATEIGKAYAAGKAGSRLARTAAGARAAQRLAALAPGAARVAARFNPASLAAITALGAIEDVGSLPEESTAGALSQAARAMDFPRVSRALEAVSESPAGRALTGATLGILPESMILGIPAAYRRARRVFGATDVGAPRPVASAVPEPTRFPQGYSAGEEASGAAPLDINALFDELAASLPVEPKRPTVSTAGSRRRPQGVAALNAEQQRMLTGALAEMQRGDLGRGATRAMAPIEAEREAQQILLRRNRENAAATTTQQKAAVERMHAEENARLEGTLTGDALKRIAPAALVGAAGVGAMSQADSEEGSPLAAMAPLFLGMAGGPSAARAAGRRLPRLYLAHNLPAEMAVRGIERGGLPAPSLAFKTPGLPHTGFGGGEFGAPVTLFGKRGLAEEVGAYAGDIYSPMYPKLELEDLEVPAVVGKTGAAVIRETPALERTLATLPPAFRTDVEEAVDTFLTTTPGAKLDVGDQVFRRIGDAVEALKRNNPDEYAKLRQQYPPTGEMPEAAEIAESLYGELANIAARPATGREQMQAALEAIRTTGNPRMAGASLEDVGSGTAIRAYGAELLPTLERIRERAVTGLRGPETVAAAQRQAGFKFANSVEDLRGMLNRAFGYGYMEPASNRSIQGAVVDAARLASDAEFAGARTSPRATLSDLRASLAQRMGDILPPDAKWPRPLEAALSQLHKSYQGVAKTPELFFEAKPQRVVGMEEFSRAMVPSSISPELKKKIADVLPVTEYEAAPTTSVFKPTPESQRKWMRGLTDAQRAAVREGGPILLGAGGIAAAAQEKDAIEAEKAGVEFGLNLPTILALGIGGAAMRSVLSRVGTARAVAAAERAAPKVDLVDLARRSSEMVVSQEARARRASRVARAGQRIAEPAGARPADAWNDPKTPTDVFQFAARIASDPDGARAVAEATEQALAGGLVRGGRITWETEKALAQRIGVDAQDLALRDPSRTLSGPEFLALSNAYEAESRRKILLRQVMDNATETPEARRLAGELYDVVDNRATTIFQRLVRDRGETGRMLNLMKAVKAQSTNPADWLYKAQKLAGGRALSPEMADDLIRAINRGEFVKAKMILNKAKAANTGILDKVGEFFQTALLSRIGRPIRDLISNSLNSLDRRAQYALADKIETVLNGMGVYPTRTIKGGVMQVNRAGKAGARKGWQQAYELIRASPNREMTPEALDALERAARRYDFTDESSFTNPFLRAWGTFVRRTIAATDQPFYEAGLAMAMETQARAIGANRGLTGDALEQFVESTLANPPSEMVATAMAEGAEAVFQNQTTLGRAAATLGGRGAKNPLARFTGKQFIPFAQTPSAIATQAVEQTPLGIVGAVLEPSQRAQVLKLAKMGTGAGWLYAGYLLADDGKMTLFYPDDPNERARWQEENKIANAILVGGKWTALSGLLGPQAMLLTIGGLVRKYMEEDGKSLAGAIAQASAVGAAEGYIETPAMQGVSSIMDILKAATQDDPVRMEEGLGRALESQVTGYIPGIIQQVAAMGDVDAEGRVIMRDPMAGETFSEDIMNALKMGIPGQRETLQPKISPFGRVRSSGPGGLTSLVTPFRTTMSQATPLTEALGDIGYFPAPSPRQKAEGERVSDYALRRQAEGPQEEAFLTRLLSGDEAAWQFVSPEAEQAFAETQDAAELVKAALRSYRSARTREQRNP